MAGGLKSSRRGACREQLLRSRRPPARPTAEAPFPLPPAPPDAAAPATPGALPVRARSAPGKGRPPPSGPRLQPGLRARGPAALSPPGGPASHPRARGADYRSGVGSRGGFAVPRNQFLQMEENKVAFRGLVPSHFAPDAPLLLLHRGTSSVAPKARGSPAALSCVPHPCPSLETSPSGLPCEGVSDTCADQVHHFLLCVPAGP